MFRKAYLKHRTPDTNNLLMRCWHFCVTFDVMTMMAGKNQAALAVCAQTKVIFPFKFSIDLSWNLWNLQIQLTFQMKIYWVPCGRNSSVFHRLFWNFSDVVCMEWRYACGLDIILWLFFFLSYSALWTLFSIWNAIKVYRQWVPCVRNSSYSFPPIVLKHCRCFQHGMKMCMCFWYNTLIIFLTFSALWTWSLFLHEMLSKCIDSGYLVGATPLIVFHWLFWNFVDVFCMKWRCAYSLVSYFYSFSLFLLCQLSLFFSFFFLHEMLPKCIDSGYLFFLSTGPIFSY